MVAERRLAIQFVVCLVGVIIGFVSNEWEDRRISVFALCIILSVMFDIIACSVWDESWFFDFMRQCTARLRRRS